MTNILLYTADDDMKQDLSAQIAEFNEHVDFTENSPDIIIVDENAEKRQKLRELYALVPIIFLSENGTDSDSDRLNIEIKKPFSLMRLLKVIGTANRRLDNSEEGNLNFNGYVLRPSSKEIVDTKSGCTVRLTEKEVDIIKYVYKMADCFVSKNDLQKNVWQYNVDVTTHTIETHIYRVRQKVETKTGRRLIVTDNGRYKLSMDE